MRKVGIFVFLGACAVCAQASWYWPFDSGEGGEAEPLRISELMEPATELIDEAADLAADGKTDESVEKYRKALLELDRIEAENPDRAKSSEFATLRNKRAYVNAAIDSMLLAQVKSNAKAVAISDTTELEKKLAEEKSGKKAEGKQVKDEGEGGGGKVEVKGGGGQRNEESAVHLEPSPSLKASAKPLTNREAAMQAMARGDFGRARQAIDALLQEKPNSPVGLNLRATLEARQGKFKEAESTLDRAIMSNPRSHFAYYNMAKLMLQMRPDDTSAAKRYYETGRALGGPADEQLEAAFR